MVEYANADALDAPVRADLVDWLLVMADNKRLLGLRYAEWSTGAPELEADITVSAMAQYELGHARLIRGVLKDLPEAPEEETRNQDPAAWRCLPALDRPLPGWTELVVANALVDTLLTVNMTAAANGGYRPLAQRLRKAVAEERYHFVHAGAWIRRLASGSEAIVTRLAGAIEDAWPQCIAFFGPPDREGALDRLAAAGVIESGAADLREAFIATTQPLFESMGMAGSSAADEARLVPAIDWKDWSETSRRHGLPDFDDESFGMLTGAHARAMGVRD